MSVECGVAAVGLVPPRQRAAHFRWCGEHELPEVVLSDAEVLRVRNIVADQVHPLPTFDVRQIEDPERPGHGIFVIAVPRSPSAPHGVLVNEGLRYPRRNGASIIYLAEAEVAAAYQDRFARRQSRHEDLLR
ncbi:hypothetical protein ACFYV5_03845 [Streptomyces sp. NPDC003035]|uniref:hypothetical protein n=1 Tax=Streptomyces sp. NPDC003035 TaxID=3364676 RepID=UPI0036B56B05